MDTNTTKQCRWTPEHTNQVPRLYNPSSLPSPPLSPLLSRVAHDHGINRQYQPQPRLPTDHQDQCERTHEMDRRPSYLYSSLRGLSSVDIGSRTRHITPPSEVHSETYHTTRLYLGFAPVDHRRSTPPVHTLRPSQPMQRQLAHSWAPADGFQWILPVQRLTTARYPSPTDMDRVISSSAPHCPDTHLRHHSVEESWYSRSDRPFDVETERTQHLTVRQPPSRSEKRDNQSDNMVKTIPQKRGEKMTSNDNGSQQLRRFCSRVGCDKIAVNRGVCARHGGGQRCTVQGCACRAQTRGLCWKHGGFKICKIEGCLKRAKSRGICWSHGGGTPCQAEGCEKIAISKWRCWAHGGGKRCRIVGCHRAATLRTDDYCTEHYSMIVDDANCRPLPPSKANIKARHHVTMKLDVVRANQDACREDEEYFV